MALWKNGGLRGPQYVAYETHIIITRDIMKQQA